MLEVGCCVRHSKIWCNHKLENQTIFKQASSQQESPLHNINMPVDFTAYLLSASPPGFDMLNTYSGAPGFGGCGNRNNFPTPRTIIANGNLSSKMASSDPELYNITESQISKNGLFRPNSTATCSANELTHFKYMKNPTVDIVITPQLVTPPKMKKRVSFADDLGFALVAIKVMEESSDMPPRLRPEILSSITLGASAGVTEKPPLKLDFEQPASDYMVFRDRLEKNNVSLENVILKDYTLMGTVRVKNLAFEKSVTVRCTFDSWETSTDINATYVPNHPVVGIATTISRYDTFKFELNVPPTMDIKKQVQFCVCYETNGSLYWDNNNGTNYGVSSEDWNKQEEEISVFTLNYERDWATYSSWSSIDSSVPYY